MTDLEFILANQELDREIQTEKDCADIDTFLKSVGDLVRTYGKLYPRDQYGSLYHDIVRDWSKDFDI